MDIKTGSMKNPGRFKLGAVDVRRVRSSDWSHVYYTLKLSLAPADQSRSRFGGSGYEARKYPATIEMDVSELKQVVSALDDEIEACHRVLLEEDLWSRIDETKKRIRQGRAKLHTPAA